MVRNRKQADGPSRGRHRVVSMWSLIAVALLLVTAGFSVAVAAAAQIATGPLTIDGDPIVSLAPGRPGGPAIYAVGGSGFYRSVDGGTTWERAGDVPPPGQLVIAEDDPTLLLAGDHPPCARGGEPEILHRSIDGGVGWQPIGEAEGVRPFAVWADAGLAVGGACDGLRVSTDAGQTWQPVEVPDLLGYDLTAFVPVPSAGEVPTVESGAAAVPAALVVATSEGGTSRLHAITFADPTAPTVSPVLTEFWGLGAVASRTMAGAPSLFLVAATDGVRLSIDEGATWEVRRNGLEPVTLEQDPLVAGVPADVDPASFGITSIALDPIKGGRISIGTVDGVYATDDAGANWTRLDGAEGAIGKLGLSEDGAALFAETADGVVVIEIPAEIG